MRNHDLRRKLFLACLISSVALAALATWYVIWSLLLPYPMHSREYIDTCLVRLLLDGKNPYAIDQNPTYLYPYGIFYHILLYPIASLFGPSLLVLRGFADFGIVAAVAVLYWGMRLTRVPPLVAVVGALLFYVHLAYNDCCSGPNPLGVTFMLLGLVIPLALDFRWSGILINIALALLAFFTKHYCILCAPVLLLYLFLYRSKGVGLAAGVIFFTLLAVFLWFLNSIFPLFLTNVFYHNINYTAAFTSYGHLLRVMAMYFPMGIGLVALLGWWLIQVLSSADSPLKAPWKFNFKNLRQPLIVTPALPWVDYLVITYGILYLVKLGPHAGNALSYVFELVTPFLIWRCCIIAGVEAVERLVPVVCLQATVVLVTCSLALPMIFNRQVDHRAEWRQIDQAVSGYHNILAPGSLDGILLARGQKVYDGGITDLYRFSFPRNPLPIAATYKQHCADFFADLAEQVREQKFDAIVLYAQPNIIEPLVPRDVVAAHYVKISELPLTMVFEHYAIEIWVPRPPLYVPLSGGQ